MGARYIVQVEEDFVRITGTLSIEEIFDMLNYHDKKGGKSICGSFFISKKSIDEMTFVEKEVNEVEKAFDKLMKDENGLATPEEIHEKK